MERKPCVLSFGQLKAAERVRQRRKREIGRLKQKAKLDGTTSKTHANLRPPWNDRFSINSSDEVVSGHHTRKKTVAHKRNNQNKDDSRHHQRCSTSSSSNAPAADIFFSCMDHNKESEMHIIHTRTDRSDGSPVLTTYCRLPCSANSTIYSTPTKNVITRSCSPMNMDEICKALGHHQQQRNMVNCTVKEEAHWWCSDTTQMTQKDPSVQSTMPVSLRDSSWSADAFFHCCNYDGKEFLNIKNFQFVLTSYRVQSMPLLYSSLHVYCIGGSEKHVAAQIVKESNIVER
jgi:hypothetical protein